MHEVLPDAVRFLQVTFLGFVFVFGFFAYQALMRGLGTVYPPMFIVLVTVLLNLRLDPLFIFGWGPMPPMGVAGAAMATLVHASAGDGHRFRLAVSGQARHHLALARLSSRFPHDGLWRASDCPPPWSNRRKRWA